MLSVAVAMVIDASGEAQLQGGGTVIDCRERCGVRGKAQERATSSEPLNRVEEGGRGKREKRREEKCSVRGGKECPIKGGPSLIT